MLLRKLSVRNGAAWAALLSDQQLFPRASLTNWWRYREARGARYCVTRRVNCEADWLMDPAKKELCIYSFHIKLSFQPLLLLGGDSWKIISLAWHLHALDDISHALTLAEYIYVSIRHPHGREYGDRRAWVCEKAMDALFAFNVLARSLEVDVFPTSVEGTKGTRVCL